jgi:hypothetical protein
LDFAHREAPANGGVRKREWGDVVDPKLAMLIVLFGAIIALSHLSADRMERLRETKALLRWRKTVPAVDEA